MIEINETLEDAPETVNDDPYCAGWMVKVQCSDFTQIEGLLDANAYSTLVTGG